ncbi:F0F1 ATP synthase subunit epsilon, partial [Mesorhizobium sanjuanii]
RIQEAKEDAADAKDDQTRSKAEQFLSQLTTLEGAILPA